jgi:hypothetical protein
MDWKTGSRSRPRTPESPPGHPGVLRPLRLHRRPRRRIPIEKPASYDQHLPDYLPLLGDFATGRQKGVWASPLPRRKVWLNGDIEALTSVNLPGVSWTWPEANRRHASGWNDSTSTTRRD